MNNNNSNRNKRTSSRPPIFMFIIISVIATVLLNTVLGFLMAPSKEQITYDEFLAMIEEDKVEEVVIENSQFIIYAKPEKKEDKKENASIFSETEMFGSGLFMIPQSEEQKVYYTGYLNDERLFDKLDGKGVKYSTPVNVNNPVVDFVLTWILPLAFMYIIIVVFMKLMSKKWAVAAE